MIAYRPIESYEEFTGLAAAWNELVLATPLAHIFMRHEWFDNWILSRDTSPRLAIQTVWRDGQLVAIAPLQRTQQKLKVVNARALTFLQSPISPRCNFIVREKEDANLLFQTIPTVTDWDMLIMENMEAAQPVTQWYTEYLAEQETEHQIEEGRQSPYLDVTIPWDEYFKNLPRDRRTFIKSECLNRLDKAESFQFERFNAASDPKRVIALIFDISERSWKANEGTAISQVKNQQRFYERFTHQALPQGWIDVRVLHIAGKPVGFDYYLHYQGNYSLIRTDFDSSAKYYHPGENLKIDLVKELSSGTLPAQLDMGGDSSLYKQKWASGVRRHVTITAGNTGLFAKAMMFGKFHLLPAMKRTVKKQPGK